MQRWLLIALLLLLQGCSTIKIAYQQLPTLSYWWLDNYLSFSDSQTAKVKDSLENLQRWHRQQELPLYTPLINRVVLGSQGNIQAQEVCTLWNDAQNRADRLVQEALRQGGPVIAALSPRQLSHLTRHYNLKNEEWEKEWLRGNSEERFKRRVGKTTERYSDFYGELSSSQASLLQTQASQSEWTPEWGLQQRKRQQQDLLTALQKIQQQNLSQAQIEAELWGVWQRWFTPPQPTDAALVQRLRAQACQNLADLHNSTSAEQRQKATRRLRGYERDLLDLMRP